MKRITKIILVILLIFITLIFIYPQKVIYQAKIIGKVLDELGNPIINATIYRIEREYFKNKEIGLIEHRDLRTDTVKTDTNGNFKFYEKSRIDWFHTPLDLAFPFRCYLEFEIEKNGYKFYKTKSGEFEQYIRKICNACDKVEFKPIMILQKINE